VRTLWLAGAALSIGIVLLLAATFAPRHVALPPYQGVSAVPYLDTGPHHFGDAFEAALDVRLASGAADAGSVTARLTVYPFSTLGRPSVTRYGDGGDRLLRYRFRLACLEALCLSQEGQGDLLLPDSLVRYRDAAGRVRSLLVGWPPVRIEPRDAGIASTRWRTDLTALPAVRTIFPSRFVALVLLAAAALALMLAVRTLRPWLAALFAWTTRDRRPPLVRALEQVRHAARHPDLPERRRALDLLARVLRGARRAGEGGEATELAWSRPEPSGDVMEDLVERIEVAGAP
jgi:hypothetical protein